MKSTLPLLIGIGAVVLAACGIEAQSEPPTPEPPPMVAMPNLVGMSDEKAKDTFEELFPRGRALSESPDSYEYGLANRCLWTDPDGGVSDQYQWTVTSVVRVIDPSLPHPSPTAPIEAGSMHDKASDMFILLTTAPPEGVWCKPYDDPGPAGSPPRVNLPNKKRDGGEPWFCRRHRWC